jgi:hypothetical protein
MAYGEEFLQVPTEAAEVENRRALIRRLRRAALPNEAARVSLQLCIATEWERELACPP